MTHLSCNNLGKKYNRDWVFRNVNLNLNLNDNIVLLGSNGSGKSTLLQTLVGAISQTKGDISYTFEGKTIPQEFWYKHISLATPYLDLYTDFTLSESIDHQRHFKPFFNDLNTNDVIELMELSHAKTKLLSEFSSGMRQRAKLALAILANTTVLGLDEPTMNLDKSAISWFQNLLNQYKENRIIITCSNEQTAEYTFANKQLNLLDYKKK